MNFLNSPYFLSSVACFIFFLNISYVIVLTIVLTNNSNLHLAIFFLLLEKYWKNKRRLSIYYVTGIRLQVLGNVMV